VGGVNCRVGGHYLLKVERRVGDFYLRKKFQELVKVRKRRGGWEKYVWKQKKHMVFLRESKAI